MSLDLIFKALSDSTRRKILKLLSERDITAGGKRLSEIKDR